MRTKEIRNSFLEFFRSRDHRVIASSSLVPGNDPTLMFTNAGMVQFKEALLGRETRDYSRATSSQRCVRAGGKHNDLENVGYTARHHTFFEMLGNFSFGDYFKEETISWAWEFVTEVLELPKDRLWITVHPSDEEARNLWIKKIGVSSERVIDHPENFWSMGDTGPCGPDSEIFFDQGPELRGGPPGSADEDGDRFLEFWNLVFPQYDRDSDGSLHALDTPGVDTGMGLERVAAITQSVQSNYEIDIFTPLLIEAGSYAHLKDQEEIVQNPSLRVIADHIRSSAFLILDGVNPGNEERSYVLRRIIRRALRHGNKLGITEPFFHRLVRPLIDVLSDQYPELSRSQTHIEQVIELEEDRFAATLSQGMSILEDEISRSSGESIPGDTLFKLYDTYGFPVDLTADVARERGLQVDQEGFDRLMQQQRERGRAASHFDASLEQSIQVEGAVEFCGYHELDVNTPLTALYVIGPENKVSEVDHITPGTDGIVVLERTPFYAEAGGQVGDVGTLETDGGLFAVSTTTRSGNQHLHRGQVKKGSIHKEALVHATVFSDKRQDIASNHSATHLLHAALKKVLGTHVDQKGSLVDITKLRFDFSHPDSVGSEALSEIEAIVNTKIRENTEVETSLMTREEANEKGAVALFGEKYGDNVRVLSMGNKFSIELCGGTHVRRTGDIGLFHIISETGIAAGVRRIEAVTGRVALDWFLSIENTLNRIAESTKGSRENISDRILDLVESNKKLQKELDTMKVAAAKNQSLDLVDRAVDVSGINVLGAVVSGSAGDVMKTLDGLKDRLGDCVVMLGYITDGKVNLACGVTKSISDKINASAAINYVGHQVGARGGGKPVMARAGGGDNTAALPVALESLAAWVDERLSE